VAVAYQSGIAGSGSGLGSGQTGGSADDECDANDETGSTPEESGTTGQSSSTVGSTGATKDAENQSSGTILDTVTGGVTGSSNSGGSNTGASNTGGSKAVAQPSSSSGIISAASSGNASLGDASTGGSSSSGAITSGNFTNSRTSDATASNNSSSAGNATGASVSNKKGAGVWAVSGLGAMVTQIGATWAYDWSDHPENSFTISTSVPAGVELLAMVRSSTDISALSSSSYKEIIGYNEPDVSGSAVDVITAISNWPAVVATGKRIGSPAPANTKLVPGDWFYDFMSGIEAKGSHVNFICLHHYLPTGSVSDFQSYIEGVYNMYRLPIWVTEWAYVDYSQTPPKVPSESEQVTFMSAAAQMMEGLSYVERYAWFALPESSAQPATELFDSSGNITPMGTAYKRL